MAHDVAELSFQVRRIWLEDGLEVSIPDLSALSATLRDRLPADFRTFLDVAGLPSEDDTKLIRFWPPAEWILTEDSLLVFADFLIDSHRYALWTSGAYQGAVSLLFGVSSDPQPPVGTTFGEFLAAYLHDDPVLGAFERGE